LTQTYVAEVMVHCSAALSRSATAAHLVELASIFSVGATQIS